MPSSLIFVGLVVIWLLILVPSIARRRQEVARPSLAALSGRVLDRPRQRRRTQEVDVVEEAGGTRPVTTRSDREWPEPAREQPDPDQRDDGVRVPAARTSPPGESDDLADPVRNSDDPAGEPADLARESDGPTREVDDPRREIHDPMSEMRDGDDRGWERPQPRYRPGRGGFDPEAAALAAQARFAFRQRVVLALLVSAVVTAIVAVFIVSGLWSPHIVVDLVLVGYLVYLRRQVRMEEAIRERRAARMAGTRRPSAAEDPELDEWARRGREAARRPPVEYPHDAATLDEDELDEPEVGLQPALPRLQPGALPALPPGVALVEAEDDDPDLHDLGGSARAYYRHAAGE
ncbi:MAG: divisome protein SepX/GlpR [Pseudonocardia sp.]